MRTTMAPNNLGISSLLVLTLLLGCGGGSGASVEVGSAPPPHQSTDQDPPGEKPRRQPTTSSSPPRYPTEQIVREQFTHQERPMPGYLVGSSFEGLETRVVRITDTSSLGPGRTFRHSYSKRQPWNADGSLLLLAFGSPSYLIDGKTFVSLGPIPVPGDPIWSNHDPDIIYGVSGNAMVKFSVSTRTQSVIRSFAEYSNVFVGGGEGNLSNDDRYVALIGQGADGVDVIVYDIVEDTVLATKGFTGYSGPYGDIDLASVSPSGRYVLVGFTRPNLAYDLFDLKTMSFMRRLVEGQLSHADIGMTSEGDEALVTQSDGTSALFTIRLDDGQKREELSSAHMSWNQHVSCRNITRPGWCYVSTYWNSSGTDAYLFRETFALKLDGTGTIQRFAPGVFSDHPAEPAYRRESHAVPNPRGDLVLFSSDWFDPSPMAAVHTYVTGVDLATP